MDRHKKFIKTSQFAKLCNVSRQTLIYYDRMGIFKPSYIDEKGYRYYSLSQHESFYVILMLRHLGTPLKEIKEYVENRSPHRFLQLLDKKQDEISKKIEKLHELSQLIEKRRTMTQYGLREQKTEDMGIYTMPEERLILSNPNLKRNELDYRKTIGDLESYINENNYRSFSTGAMITYESLIKEKYEDVSHFFVKSDAMCERTLIKRVGLYAVNYHYGDFDTTHLTCQRLVKYIQDNGFEITGNAYVEWLLDDCTQQTESEYLSKISIEVSPQ